MLNDYSDQEVDQRAGKVNIIGEIPQSLALLFLLLVFISGVMVLLLFYRQPFVLWSVVLAYVLAAAYSLYPMRLKERGFLGLLVGAIAQRVLPAFILFAIYNHWNADTAALLILYAIIGLRWMLIHQILDESNDHKAGVRTFVTQKSANKAKSLLRQGVFPIEICAGIVTIMLTGITSTERGLILLVGHLT